MTPVIKKFQFGQSTVTLETGRIARQASGAVLVTEAVHDAIGEDAGIEWSFAGAKHLKGIKPDVKTFRARRGEQS